jgi:hypothetical protein
MTKPKANNSELEQALNYDALDTAEKIFGKDTDEARAFGLFSFMENNQKKKTLLEEKGDSTFSTKTQTYIRIITKFGFEQIYKEYIHRERRDERRRDEFYVFWHDELGILLHFDTYNGNVNGGNFHYNWFIPYSLKHYQYCSNGGFQRFEGENVLTHYDKDKNLLDVREKIGNYKCPEQQAFNKELFDTTFGLWTGYTDCREAIIHNITRIKEAPQGELLSQWIDIAPTFKVTCGKDYDKDDKENLFIDHSLRRIEQFPENVKEKICYDKILKQHKKWKKQRI